MDIVDYSARYRDDMIFMVLEAKDALGRVPRLNEDLLDVPASYFAKGEGFWLAVEADRVMGCIGTRTGEDGTAWLSRLYVKASRKRKGIGTRLLETAEDFLRGRGIKAVHVHLGADYFESHHFYPKHGYREYAPLYMVKSLAEEEGGGPPRLQYEQNKKGTIPMTKREKMTALRNDPSVHYNCAQSVLIPFAEDIGITEEQANDLMLNFGGGMGCGSVCGAVTGALAAMGGLGLPQEKRVELIRQFRNANGALDCAALLKAAVERGEERKAHCDRMIDECMDFVCRESGRE